MEFSVTPESDMAGAMVFVMIVDIFPASQNDAQRGSTPVVRVRSLHHNTLGFSTDWCISEQDPDAILMTRPPLQESSAIKAVKVGFHHLNQIVLSSSIFNIAVVKLCFTRLCVASQFHTGMSSLAKAE
jgi:hypothetical protein